jgi:hypothetical protein
MDVFGHYIDLDAAWIGALIQALGTVIGAFLGALVIFYQIGRQFKHGRELQAENKRQELFLEIYKLLVDQIQVVIHQVIVAQRSKFIPSRIKLYWMYKHQSSLPPYPITDRAENVSAGHTAMKDAVLHSLYSLERYEIVIPPQRC